MKQGKVWNIRSMDVSKKGVYFKVIIILGSLAGIMPLSIDMYLPAFNKIAESLHTDVEHIGITLSAFFIGVCLGQLFYGPLMDRYGRYKPLIGGLLLFIAASFGSIFVTSIEQLIVLRFLQAFGGCATFVANRAIARDLFPGKDLVKVFSMLMLVIGVAPIAAPTLGSFIIMHFDWHVIFIVLVVIATILLFALLFLLGETKTADKSISLKPIKVVKSYYKVFRNPVFIFHTLAFSFASAALFAYVTGSPFVFMKLHGLNEQQFGIAFGFNAGCLVIGSQLNRYFIKLYSSRSIAVTSIIMVSLIASILLFLNLLGYSSLIVIISCISFCLFLIGIFNPNATAIALSPFGHHAGIASALSGFCQMGINAIASLSVSYFSNGTAMPMISIIFICATLSLLSLFGINLTERRKVWKESVI